jgi:ribosomal protein L35AE/L33A
VRYLSERISFVVQSGCVVVGGQIQDKHGILAGVIAAAVRFTKEIKAMDKVVEK